MTETHLSVLPDPELVAEEPADALATRDERGMTTAEYAVGIIGAVLIAAILAKVATDASVIKLFVDVVKSAIDFGTGLLGKKG